MIKRILVPLDPSVYTENAFKVAISLAKIYSAEITGLVVLDIPGIESATGPLPPGVGFFAKELEHAKIDRAKVHIRNLLSKYKAICENEGVTFKESNAQGSPSKRISEFSSYFDIVITGLRNQYNFETSDDVENTLDKILDNTPTPIIAIPDTMSKFWDTGETFKVAIAYNGCLSSARALQRFAQMELPKKVEVTLIISISDLEKGNAMLDEAEEFLKMHKINNIKKRVSNKNKIELFHSQFLSEMDIVVLGGHSKMGLFDFLTGSLARHLINENKTLVFVCQ